ncbi:SGNH/GDSL hydrolase family protein [Microbacterium sp. 1P10AE]|uniref:SGNH/GDSL hydrolase family protein n=1 Tax=Microbacterium sp. 1P10AE TaxID=3132286 RepID=UPI0039A00FBC
MTPRRRASTLLLAAAAVSGLATMTACAPEPSGESPDRVAAVTFPSPSVTAAAPQRSSAPLRIVTLGDSLMAGSGLERDEAWPQLLAQRDDVSVTNLACGGMGFVVSGECGTSYAGFSPAIAALQPELILVQSSSNDFWQDADDIRTDTNDTVNQLRDAAPDARIVGLSTIWNDDPAVPDDTATTSDALRDAVDSVGGTFIDIGQPLVGHPEWMQDDDVHPTARGERAIEQTVFSALEDAGVLS